MFIFIYWYFFVRYILIIRVRFTTEFFSNTDLSDWRGCFARWGTVFQTAVTICHGNPETSSRVTLASLGIGFQPNLMVVGYLWIKHQYKKKRKIYLFIFIYWYFFVRYILIIRVRFATEFFFPNADLSDWHADTSLLLNLVGLCSFCTLRTESQTAHKGKIRERTDPSHPCYPWLILNVASEPKASEHILWGTIFQTK